MNTRLSEDEKNKLRREIGLLTIAESAGILDCEEIDVHRQVCFGQFALNQDATGRFLISQADLHGFAGSSLASCLNETPKLGPDGWFRQTGPMDRDRFLKNLAASSPRQYLTGAGRAELREYLVGQLRAAAFQKVKSLPINLASRSRNHAEKFYKAGPQFFKTVTQDAKRSILNRKFEIGGRETKLSAVIPSLSREIDQAIKEAF